jgi:hypothetical protein
LEIFVNILLGIHKDAVAFLVLGTIAGLIGTMIRISRRAADVKVPARKDFFDLFLWSIGGGFFSLMLGTFNVPVNVTTVISLFSPNLYDAMEKSASVVITRLVNLRIGGGNGNGNTKA